MAGRVKRSKVKKKFTKYTYAKALPLLLKDFEDRCAYSLIHTRESDGFEVDHFNPKLKTKHVHKYENLLPAFRSCNRNKGATWPSPADRAVGIRLIDPTKEIDYGVHIFENPITHKLEGCTPAGKYHIRVMGLNSDFLVDKRRVRAQLRSLLAHPTAFKHWVDPSTGKCHAGFEALREVVRDMIPDIPAPPSP